MKRVVLFAFALVACSKPPSEDARVEKFEGSAKLEGKKIDLVSCKAITASKKVGAELRFGGGVVVIHDPMEGLLDGDSKKLACARSSLSLVSGSAGEKQWTQGTLSFLCQHPKGELDVDVLIDCGSKSRPSNEK